MYSAVVTSGTTSDSGVSVVSNCPRALSTSFKKASLPIADLPIIATSGVITALITGYLENTAGVMIPISLKIVLFGVSMLIRSNGSIRSLYSLKFSAVISTISAPVPSTPVLNASSIKACLLNRVPLADVNIETTLLFVVAAAINPGK